MPMPDAVLGVVLLCPFVFLVDNSFIRMEINVGGWLTGWLTDSVLVLSVVGRSLLLSTATAVDNGTAICLPFKTIIIAFQCVVDSSTPCAHLERLSHNRDQMSNSSPTLKVDIHKCGIAIRADVEIKYFLCLEVAPSNVNVTLRASWSYIPGNDFEGRPTTAWAPTRCSSEKCIAFVVVGKGKTEGF